MSFAPHFSVSRHPPHPRAVFILPLLLASYLALARRLHNCRPHNPILHAFPQDAPELAAAQVTIQQLRAALQESEELCGELRATRGHQMMVSSAYILELEADLRTARAAAETRASSCEPLQRVNVDVPGVGRMQLAFAIQAATPCSPD